MYTKHDQAEMECCSQGRRNVGRAEEKLRAMQTYEKQKNSLPMIMPVTRRGAGGLVSHEKLFPSLEKSVGHSYKNLGSSQ